MKFRLIVPDLLQPFVTDNDRYQIRLREITIILCILFGTHRIRISLIIVPAAGLLYNLLPGFNQINLAGCLGFNGMCDCLKRTNIFHLGTGTKLFGALFTN